MMNGNDFHGSAAFRAQTVPRADDLDESCRKNGKKFVTHINITVIAPLFLLVFVECMLDCLFTNTPLGKTDVTNDIDYIDELKF